MHDEINHEFCKLVNIIIHQLYFLKPFLTSFQVCSKPPPSDGLTMVFTGCAKAVFIGKKSKFCSHFTNYSKYSLEPNGMINIARSCSYQKGNVSECSPVKGKVEHCSICYTDECNKSSFTTSSIWSTLLPVVIAVFFKFF